MDVAAATGDDATAQDAGLEVRGPHRQLLHPDVRPDVLRPEAGAADGAAARLPPDQPRVWDRQQCHLVSAEGGGGGWNWTPSPPLPALDDDSSHPPV